MRTIHHRRTPLALVAAAVLALGVAGCGTTGRSADSAPKKASAAVDYNPQPYDNVKEGGTLRVPGSVFEQGNPFQADANLDAQRFWFWYNADTITYSPTGQVQYNPDYFSHVKVETVGGNQRVTIDLNPKAVFNDGTPIDYRAIEATWKANNGSDKAYAATDPTSYGQITGVHAGSSARQAVIDFKGVDPWWSALFLTILHPKAAADAKTFNTAYLKKVQPQWGAGPYRVTSYNQQTGDAVFERNPRWWGRKGRLDKKVYVGLGDNPEQAEVNAFRDHEIDYTTVGSDADGLKQISGVKGTEIRKSGSPFEYFFYLNAKSPLLSDATVRKAVLESVDRKQIAAIHLQGLDYSEPLPGSELLYSFQKGYQDNVSTVIPYDVAGAKKALDADGWKPGSDGVRVKAGKRLELGYTLIGDDPLDKATANALAAELKPIGIKLDIKTVAEADFDSVVSGRKFDIFLAGNRYLDPFGAHYLSSTYGSKSSENITGTGTAELDKEIAAAAQIADPDEQIAKANQIERKELAQYGSLPLFSGPSIYGVTKGLANIGGTIYATPLPETVGWQK